MTSIISELVVISEETASSAVQLADGMGDNIDRAEEMSGIAAELLDEIGQFKLGQE